MGSADDGVGRGQRHPWNLVGVAVANEAVEDSIKDEYKYGFTTDIEADQLPPGLDEGTVRAISQKKEEPEWMLKWRLDAFRKWKKLKEPNWAYLNLDPINYQDIIYYSAPKQKVLLDSLDEVDPKLLETYEKLGLPLQEQKRLAGVAIDAVFDSVSVATTNQAELEKVGVIFCSISKAIKEYPDLVRKYLGSVVPVADNFFAALNCAVFTDGSFVYIPPGVKCPLDLSTYFRINAEGTGQFERTLIIADKGAQVTYLEGCTAPMRDENQLHAAVVELITLEDADINYTTVQNWYAGDENGVGGIFNFVTKRGLCKGDRSHISWTQVETGSAITWKYPSCILKGDYSRGEFYSVAITNHKMQADTGTKMIHIGKGTRSRILSKGISAQQGKNSYRGEVTILPSADGARNHTQCDSLLLSGECEANTFPYINVKNKTAIVEHEATASKVGEEQLFYLQSRGLTEEDATKLIINGYCEEVFKQLPMEFAIEANRLLDLKLEGCIG